MHEIEEILNRELHEVAGDLHVPPLPVLPEEPASRRPWLPVLAAAAVVLVLLGVIAVVSMNRDDSAPDPAPSTPTPTPSETKTTEPPVEVSTDPPTIPYTLDDQLYVDGEQVPGTWWYLEVGGPTWLAMNADDQTWYWGHGPELNEITDMAVDLVPVLSPNGSFIAVVRDYGLASVVDTRDGGEVDSLPVDLHESGFRIRGVTNNGNVVMQGSKTAVLWLLDGRQTVDITMPTPGDSVESTTAAGLLVRSEDETEHYLAEISDDGTLTKTQDLPELDSLAVSTAAEWMAWTPLGTLGGEVTQVGSLEAGSVDGGQVMTFTAPDGWGFKVQQWAWENDDTLVSPLVSSRGLGKAEGLARCSVLTQSCVLIDTP